MANVQLENGYVRTANQLEEAIIWAPFDGSELRIVRAIIRLTYGWRRRTVRISQVELAQKCRTTATGGWRRKFESLIREGVLVEVQAPTGRTPGAYAMNKNFERWGVYSVPAAALEATFRDRPNHVDDDARAVKRIAAASVEEFQRDLNLDGADHDDVDDDLDDVTGGHGALTDESRRLPPQGQSNADLEGRSMPPQGQSTEIRLPLGVTLTAPTGNSDRPHRGSHDAPKSNNDNELGPRKDIGKTEKDSSSKDRAAAAAVGSTEFETRIVNAARDAVGRRWPGKSLSVRHAGDVVQALLDAGIDPEFAVDTIKSAIARKLGDPPASIAWLKGRILDAHRDREHEERKHGGDPDPKPRRTAKASPLADLVDPDAAARREQDVADYNAARAAAAMTWAKDPANAAQVKAINVAANAAFAEYLSTSWGQSGRDRDILDRLVQAVPFPDIDAWLSERKGAGQTRESANPGRRRPSKSRNPESDR